MLEHLELIKQHKLPFLLFALTAATFAALLTVDLREGSSLGSSISSLYNLMVWAFVLGSLFRRRHELEFNSSPIATGIGLLFWLRSLISAFTTHASQGDVFYRAHPLLAGLGLALIASGFHGIKQYWRELLCLSIFLADLGFDNISLIDAYLTFFLLWYIGIDGFRQGTQITLFRDNTDLIQAHSIDVARGCSTVILLIPLIKLTMLICLLIHFTKKQKIILLVLCVIVAFFLNSIRIGLMAWLVSQQDMVSFEYWHGDPGAQIFSTIASFLLLGLAYGIEKLGQPRSPAPLDL
jgi:cyanoexosortase A